MFCRIDQVLRTSTKNNGIIRNDIEGNVLFYRLVSYPSLAISANEENEPNWI